MNQDSLEKMIVRGTFAVAVISILVACAEGLIQLLGTSIVSGMYSPGRFLDLAATLLAFVAVMLLRQIRDSLKRS